MAFEYGTRADAWYRFQSSIALASASQVQGLWAAAVQPDAITESWFTALPKATRIAYESALLAGSRAGTYVGQSVGGSTAVKVVPEKLISGTDIYSELASVARYVQSDIDRGLPVDQAMQRGGVRAGRVSSNVARDTGRQSASLGIMADTRAKGFVRYLKSPSCGRCTILAGKVYAWNDGFKRHPNCDCQHRPLNDPDFETAETIVETPQQAFDNMSKAEQDKAFGKEQAEEVRAGKNPISVVNRSQAGMSYPRSPNVRNANSVKNTAGFRDIVARSGGSRSRAIETARELGMIV